MLQMVVVLPPVVKGLSIPTFWIKCTILDVYCVVNKMNTITKASAFLSLTLLCSMLTL